jgi:hypothetical protein
MVGGTHMTKFMVLYNSEMSAKDTMASASPEEMKASMNEWIKWADEANKKVKFDFGLPLQIITRVTTSGETKSDNQASGYSMIEGDKDAILELLKTHPQLKQPGASIDLLEMLPIPGM